MNNKRLGMIFDTDENSHYFYDSGTGKVVQCNNEEKSFISRILNDEMSIKDACRIKPEFNDFIKSEHLFSCPEKRKFQFPTMDEYKNMVQNSCEQILLELTEKCNLKCGYCIYNDHHPQYRGFSNKNMSFDTAKKSIDYILSNFKGDEFALTFYGGEPLINFDVMKQSIEYVKSMYPHLTLTYGFTTNATLITNEMIDYFNTLENIDIMCSIDGPRKYHDKYRRNRNGDGSFDDAISGVQMLIDKFYNVEKKRTISINSVLAPPYSEKKFDEVKSFFLSEIKLPPEISCKYNYLDPGEMCFDFNTNEVISINDLADTQELGINPLESWAASNYFADQDKYNHFDMIQIDLARIARRLRVDDGLIEETFLHGNCIPGKRRVYVTVDGDFKICENAGSAPQLGNYKDGFDFDEVYKTYITDYIKHFEPLCDNCWARPMCGVCYENVMDGVSDTPYSAESACNIETKTLKDTFILYYRLFELDKESLDEAMKKIEIS